MSCVHGVSEKAVEDERGEIYKREKETGMREWGYLCSCCMAPSGDLRTCPTCSLVEGEA